MTIVMCINDQIGQLNAIVLEHSLYNQAKFAVYATSLYSGILLTTCDIVFSCHGINRIFD